VVAILITKPLERQRQAAATVFWCKIAHLKKNHHGNLKTRIHGGIDTPYTCREHNGLRALEKGIIRLNLNVVKKTSKASPPPSPPPSEGVKKSIWFFVTSFRRKPESSVFKTLRTCWTPVFTGVTAEIKFFHTFSEGEG
jgi:hypothetical protein